MNGGERRRYTEDEYVALEQRAEAKSELVGGKIRAIAGTMPRHNAIAVNLASDLLGRLRASEGPYRVFGSNQRIRSEVTGMNTYADAVVACRPRFHAKYRDALDNPKVVVEVLSRSTEDYDHGAKFAHYRTIPSFVEYVLISQRKRQVEHFRRLETGQWLLTVLELPAVGCSISLREIYAETEDLPGDDEIAREVGAS